MAKSKKKQEGLSKAQLEELIEEAIVDAYDESEQSTGFFTMFEEHLEIPFTSQVLGVEVTVVKIDINDRDDVVAVCKRGRVRQAISILDLPLPIPRPKGWEWIEAYRHWARGWR
jgi:hypothetical protein